MHNYNPHSKGNGRKWGDIIKHLQVKSGPWLKDVLRQIELAIITQQMNNTKLEILEWVMRMSKYTKICCKNVIGESTKSYFGQFIADQLNISRAGVKKIIDQLKMTAG